MAEAQQDERRVSTPQVKGSTPFSHIDVPVRELTKEVV